MIQRCMSRSTRQAKGLSSKHKGRPECGIEASKQGVRSCERIWGPPYVDFIFLGEFFSFFFSVKKQAICREQRERLC